MPQLQAESVLEVQAPELWAELQAVVPLDTLTLRVLDERRRVVAPAFETQLPALQRAGLPILVRYARRTAAAEEAIRHDLEDRMALLTEKALCVLHRAQRHARLGVVLGAHAWDPLEDAPLVNALHGQELLFALPSEAPPRHGPYALHPDLPDPPEVAYDLEDAVMPPTDDLDEPPLSPIDVLHDLASWSAALHHHPAKRTLQGTLDKATVRKLGERLGSKAIASSGDLAQDPRWQRSLVALEALGAIAMDPQTRELHAEPGLEALLQGSTADALDRFVHRLVEPDLQGVLPALRAALVQAGDEAIDVVVWKELLCDQHRDIVFAPWRRDGLWVYPQDEGSRIHWTPEAFEMHEGPLIDELLRIAHRLGLVRAAPGVFAATVAGQVWARGREPAAGPVYVTSDLEVWVPPLGVTPWERYQLERLGRCEAREVVDRYRLDRQGLTAWLATHDLDQALALLRRRSPEVPRSVVDTLGEWARGATRFVLTRGVLGA